MIHLKITSKKKLFQKILVTYFDIFQKMLHFYLNSPILLSYFREIFHNFDVQFHLTMIMLKYSF